jgi:glycosyltransferase involved in cell wall biosynthesis
MSNPEKAKILKILHITPHLGGGVGRVLLNYLIHVKKDPICLHKVLSLEYANDKAILVSQTVGFPMIDKMSSDHGGIIAEIAKADIVLIHWWNHPLLYDFLVRSELPPCRMAMWSHISGFHPPYVFTDKILRYPDLFVFTTPVSYQTKEVQPLSDEQKKYLRVVWSTGGVNHVKNVKPKVHSGFNVGYIGTVDYCKMHPDFLNICSRVDIPGVKFIVCGGPKEKELQQEAERLGIADKFNFTGLVPDIAEYLALFDIFGYPLAPYHYGTCDQVLAESMAAGVVPVVLDNKMESYMIKDGVTGIVAKSQEGYIKAIENLYFNEDLRLTLSVNAKEYAIKKYSVETLKQEWEKIFEEILPYPKTIKKWEMHMRSSEISAKDIFLESLGNYGEVFASYCNAVSVEEREKSSGKIKELGRSANWQAGTRGTVHHYNIFFPGDQYLSAWNKLMSEGEAVTKGEICKKIH